METVRIINKPQCRSKVSLKYEYDLGAGWEHEIKFLGVEDTGLRVAFTGMAEPVYKFPFCFGGDGSEVNPFPTRSVAFTPA